MDDEKHEFVVTITGCDREAAETVMTERIEHDEDYGFDYSIEWKSKDEG
jgi:hypothetical protein